MPPKSDVKMESREDEVEGEERGEQRKGKQTSWSQEHLLALRKPESVANRNLTKLPSTGFTKYLTGTVPWTVSLTSKIPFSLESTPTSRFRVFLQAAMQGRSGKPH